MAEEIILPAADLQCHDGITNLNKCEVVELATEFLELILQFLVNGPTNRHESLLCSFELRKL